ncbi:MAG: hypothetical protein H7333_03495 [Bdellovibrionales bacterium]|nr:hypothetical protein [Oligoflexia bacterium]
MIQFKQTTHFRAVFNYSLFMAISMAQFACSATKQETVEAKQNGRSLSSQYLIDSSSSIPSLSLINSSTNFTQALDGVSGHSAILTDGSVIYLGSTGTKLNIRADIAGAGSVRFGFDGQTNFHIENVSPYAFAGDSNGIYNAWTPVVGAHVMTVTAYSGADGSGTTSQTLTVHFSVSSAVSPNPLTVTGLTLINSTSNLEQTLDGIAGHPTLLSDGSTIDLAKTGKSLNIRADVNSAASVLFNLDNGTLSHVENVVPYALASDNGGIYNSWTPKLGLHTLAMRAYSGSNASGTAGSVSTTRFTVIDSSLGTSTPAPTAAATPSPAPTLAPAPGLSVSSLTLINANSSSPQALDGIAGHSATLTDNSTFDLAQVGRALNVRADISSAGSVRFDLDNGAMARIENSAPYALASDNSGVYNSWLPIAGTHTLKVTAYSGSNATSTASPALIIHFTVKNSAPVITPTPSATATPAPVSSLPGVPASTIEPTSYSGPIVISKGGTYTGNWKSMDMNTAAVTVTTSEPVIIQNCHVAGNSDLIFTPWSYVHLTVRNCSFHGKAPNLSGRSRGKAINAQRYKNLIVENNYFENTGAAIFSNEYSGDGSLNETLRIRFNRVRNLDGRWSDGVKKTWIQFVQSANYIQPEGNPRGAEIAWNEVINEPGVSVSEDLINFYMAGGRSDSPFKVHDNFLRGSYPNEAYASGSGIQIDGKDHTKTAYIDVYQNTVMDTLNGGMGMAAGSHVHMHHNRIISSGKYADGNWMPGNYGGVWIFDYYGAGGIGTMSNNFIDNNVIGWANEYSSSRTPYAYRLDYTNNLGGGIQNNTHLPDAPITRSMEDAEYQTFLQKVQSNSVRLGPQQ